MIPTLARLGLRPTGRGLEETLARLDALGWTTLAEGHHATVFAHPDHPDAVVRAGNAVDGMARWLLLSRGALRPFVGRHVPVLQDAVLTDDGGMVLVAERLEETDPDDPVVADARRLLAGLPPEDAQGLAARQPLLPAFAEAFRKTARRRPDLREGNILRRGRHLVLNDPFGTCLTDGEIRLLEAALPLRPWTAGDLPSDV